MTMKVLVEVSTVDVPQSEQELASMVHVTLNDSGVFTGVKILAYESPLNGPMQDTTAQERKGIWS